MTDDKKVYKKDIRYARANNEMKQWEKSNVLNHRCAVAVDKAISQTVRQAAGRKYDFSDTAARLIDEYGTERIKCVLANMVHYNYDGAEYSESSRAWANANNINANSVAGVTFYLHSEAGIVDEFITAVKERFAVLDKSRASAKSARPKPTLSQRLKEGMHRAAEQEHNGNSTDRNKNREGIE